MHSLNTQIHIVCGGLALALGLVPLLSPKGRRLHRLFGWLFVIAGTGLLGAALAGILFWPQPGPLVIATLSAGYNFVGALRALPRFRTAPGVIDAVLAVAALTACAWLMLAMGRGNASWPPVLGYTILGMLSAIAIYDLSRHLWAQTWRTHVREIDHGLKMTGAYFAMMSAGAGSLLRDGQPWSQILPQAVGTLVMILFLVLHIRKARRGQG
ncbi:hypothetical protein ABAC460_01505 [Asticcacaulis sp. AC460]|uniref:hypothetical protein n=1 Tax=Asticcacaulis sp. AC460 TaxID=1282360 RepID=UPI0003C3CB42|nr:hypothetical protein [Asticcacaulis sp. AC460]ESQ92952.1 hypothetical protein ABAC460_01505 [Asticcacaulis sp. AC460]